MQGDEGPDEAGNGHQEQAAYLPDSIGTEVGQGGGPLQHAAHQLAPGCVGPSTADKRQGPRAALWRIDLQPQHTFSPLLSLYGCTCACTTQGGPDNTGLGWDSARSYVGDVYSHYPACVSQGSCEHLFLMKKWLRSALK